MSSQDSSKDSELVHIVSCYSEEIKLAETVIFPKEFNGNEISNIPEGVKHAEIRKVKYTQRLIRLPKSLKTLYLDCSFKEIELPDSLEYLELGMNSKGIIHQWPKLLRKLLVREADICPLPPLPDSLEYLNIDIASESKFKKYQWTGFPKSLKTLIISSWIGKIEECLWLKDLSSLRHLELIGTSSVSTANNIIKNLPSGLKILKGLDLEFSKDIQGQFPESLENIIGDFNYKGALPKSLKVFYCPSCKIRNSILPESLQYLCVFSIEGEGLKAISQLPKLKTLICHIYNPYSEKNVSFPSSLEHLQIKSSAYITKFPNSLKTLIIPMSALSGSIKLPEKLESLKLMHCGFTLDIDVPSELSKITFQCN
jgi:hypothetical protein